MDQLLFSKTMLGALAGVLAWFIQATIGATYGLAGQGALLRMAIVMGIFGLVVCAANTASEGYYELTRIDPVDVLFSVILGALLGGGAGALVQVLTSQIQSQGGDSTLSDLAWFASWVVVGAGIGIGTAVRVRHHSNERLKNGLLGGVLGGLLGGLVYAVGLKVDLDGWLTKLIEASCYSAVGGAVAAGIGLAPGLAAKATLRLIRSESYGARRKLSQKKAWPLEKEPVVVGRSPLGTAEVPKVFVVPDEKAADLHAVIRYEDGRFKLYYPAENLDPGGRPRNLVYTGNTALAHGAMLKNGMRLVFGSTELEFNLKKDDAS